LENIAAGICSKFSVTREELSERHRGGDASDARKTVAYIAAKEYRAPLQIVADVFPR
jgi:chromosomal replication initiation ATPase DnaA